MHRRDAMDIRATIIMLVLCLLWGGNQVAIKLSNAGMAPIFAAAVRSVVAGALVFMRVFGVGGGIIIGLYVFFAAVIVLWR